MEQFELLRMAAATLERLAVPYAVVGSWGSGLYGEPHFTRDIDIVMDMSLSAVPQFCAAFPSDDFYLSADAVRDAVLSPFQFNLLHPASGNKIDFIMTTAQPWSGGQLRRRRRIELKPGPDGFHGYVAAPEDVILGKRW